MWWGGGHKTGKMYDFIFETEKEDPIRWQEKQLYFLNRNNYTERFHCFVLGACIM